MASTGERWRLGRRPALDGVRGIALLLVFASHSYLPGFQSGGAVGVTVFFTLSGFLITALLLEEHHNSGRISVTGFYARRARRLLPALAVSTAAVSAVGLLIGSWFLTWADVAGTALYFGNWIQVTGRASGLSGTWSLAVEEQFYLVWPIIAVVCLRRSRRALAAVAVVGILASVVARTWLWHAGASQARLYYGSDMHADALLVGCLLAIALTSSRATRQRPILAALSALALLPISQIGNEGLRTVLLPVAVPLLTVALIWSVTAGEKAPAWLCWHPLAWVGRRSYGIYLWHCPVAAYLTLQDPGLPWQGRLIMLSAISLPMAVLSWRWVEAPDAPARAYLSARRAIRQDPSPIPT